MSRPGPYHIQVEDRGPILDALVEREVRRLNVIVYANYGEPNARIIHGRDHDFEDIRSGEYNRYVEQRIQDLAAGAKGVIEEKERRQVERIKGLVREYYLTKDGRQAGVRGGELRIPLPVLAGVEGAERREGAAPPAGA